MSKTYIPESFGNIKDYPSLAGLCEELNKLPQKTSHRIASHIHRFLENVATASSLRSNINWFSKYGPYSIPIEQAVKRLKATDRLVKHYKETAMESFSNIWEAKSCIDFANSFIVGVSRNFFKQTTSRINEISSK